MSDQFKSGPQEQDKSRDESKDRSENALPAGLNAQDLQALTESQ